MERLKFNIVNPNLYLYKNNNMLFIGFYSEGFISVSRTVDEVIGKHIGNLKVKESDLFLLTNGGKVKSSEKFEIPLEKYLNALETELKTGILSIVPHGAASELFDLGYSIKSVTMEYPSKVKEFIMLKEFLADPHKALYDFNNNNPLFLLDSQGTLSRINGLYEELASEMPDVIARFSVPGGYSSSSLGLKHIGVINIQQLKEGTDIEKARDDLIER